MATSDTNTAPFIPPPEAPLGAYAASVNRQSGLDNSRAPAIADDNAARLSDKDMLWLKNLGITTANPDGFQKAWATDAERSKIPTWRESYGGRVAIRTFSRGIMGAAFFTAGQLIESAALKNYSPHVPLKELLDIKSPLQTFVKLAARAIDSVPGNIIKGGAYAVSRAMGKDKSAAEAIGLRAVTFRGTRQYAGYNTIEPLSRRQEKGVWGRSLGHEGMAITFDFGMASLGDYTGRELANLFDPHAKKSWIQDGKINVGGAAKSFLKHVRIGLTRAMGEDYFTMLMGYPYVIRMSRRMINHYSPGFKYDSDYALNGGSFKVDDQKKLIGNYQLEGMADLGFRFTIYNWYTKMYRDLYDWVSEKFSHKWKGDKDVNVLRDLFREAVHFPHYFARTVIKMTMIMIPSTFFFYITRSPQSKDIGLAIHPEHGPIGGVAYKKGADGKELGDGLWHSIHANGSIKGKRSGADDIGAFVFQKNRQPIEDHPFKVFKREDVVGYEQRFDPYIRSNNIDGIYGDSVRGRKAVVWHNRITNPIGLACYSASHLLTEGLKPIVRSFVKDPNIGVIAEIGRKMSYASISYTPYFALKTDLLTAGWDTPRMDMALDRALHGLEHFRFAEFTAGCSDTWHALWGRPFDSPEREQIAQAKMRVHKNQLWGEAEEIEASLAAEQKISRGAVSPLAGEDMKKKPFTQLVSRAPAAASIRPRETSYRQQELSKNLTSGAAMGHA